MKRSRKNKSKHGNGLLKRKGRILVYTGRIPDIDIEEAIRQQRKAYRGQ